MPKSTACRRCGEERHYTGSRWRCSRCYNEWQTRRRETLSPEQRETQLARDRKNTKARRDAWSLEHRELQNAAVRAWRKANPERYLEGGRDWYRRNAGYARAAKIAEYQANPESFYARNLVRKARLADAVCEHGPECVSGEFLKVIYGSACVYCGAPAQHADHFYPLVRGGLHCVENMVPSCQRCNNSKCARDPFEFMSSREGSADGAA